MPWAKPEIVKVKCHCGFEKTYQTIKAWTDAYLKASSHLETCKGKILGYSNGFEIEK